MTISSGCKRFKDKCQMSCQVLKIQSYNHDTLRKQLTITRTCQSISF